MKLINPATEEVLAELEEDNASTIERKTAAARTAQRSWARTQLA